MTGQINRFGWRCFAVLIMVLALSVACSNPEFDEPLDGGTIDIGMDFGDGQSVSSGSGEIGTLDSNYVADIGRDASSACMGARSRDACYGIEGCRWWVGTWLEISETNQCQETDSRTPVELCAYVGDSFLAESTGVYFRNAVDTGELEYIHFSPVGLPQSTGWTLCWDQEDLPLGCEICPADLP